MRTNRYNFFMENITQDMLLFIFFLLVLTIYRASFIFLFRGELLPATPALDIWLTLWYGFRLSLKTSAALIIPSFVFATLGVLFIPRLKGELIRFLWAAFALIVLSFLFQTRIPYYKEFHNAFDPFIFNTMHDDVLAIADTAIKTYGALWRIPLALFLGLLFSYLLFYWLKIALLLNKFWVCADRKILFATIIFIPWFAVFMRYGGSLTYDGSIYWKNCARLSQHLLNEAVLDDVQALYKASRIFKYFLKNTENMTSAQVREAAAVLTGKPYTENSILPLLEKKTKGFNYIGKPRHIFVIVAETYMLWPLWDKYENLNIANGIKALSKEKNALLIENFLPASNGTMFGLASVLLGLPELNLYTANRARTPYITALSVQLNKLGYENRFFYGGYPSWENVSELCLNQQFHKSYFMASFGNNLPHNAWGIEDKYFFNGIKEKFSDDKPSFNLILTSSNHPPYSIDMDKEQDVPSAEYFAKILPENYPAKDEFITKLRNFFYSDKHITAFIKDMYAKYPDSLFIMTGDHADRYTLNSSPQDFERRAVPLLLFGKGINKANFQGSYIGSHMDIAPTLLELILPRGSVYYALGNNIFDGNKTALHSYNFLYKNAIGELSSDKTESIDGKNVPPAEEIKEAKAKLEAKCKIAWQYIVKGSDLE